MSHPFFVLTPCFLFVPRSLPSILFLLSVSTTASFLHQLFFISDFDSFSFASFTSRQFPFLYCLQSCCFFKLHLPVTLYLPSQVFPSCILPLLLFFPSSSFTLVVSGCYWQLSLSLFFVHCQFCKPSIFTGSYSQGPSLYSSSLSCSHIQVFLIIQIYWQEQSHLHVSSSFIHPSLLLHTPSIACVYVVPTHSGNCSQSH